jgi:hypothetical protein
MKRVLAYLTILIVAAGCGLGEALADYGDPVDMRPADLVGKWHGGSTRSIVFDESGTFSASNLPYAAFDDFVPSDFDPARERLDGSGTWTLEASPQHPDGPKAIVALSYRRLAGQEVAAGGPDLTALRQDGVVSLVFFYVSDGGNSWTAYQKCTPDCT